MLFLLRNKIMKEGRCRSFHLIFVTLLILWTASNAVISWSLFYLDENSSARSRALEGKSLSPESMLSYSRQQLRSPAKTPNVQRKIKFKESYDVCVIGAGLSGTVFAERSSTLLNKSVLVIEERQHLGGNCFDYQDEETGIVMNKYGAHLFHTNDEKVFRYISMHPRAPKWERWDHKVLGQVQGRLVPIPVNIETVNVLLNQSIKNEEEMMTWLQGVQEPCKGDCKDAEEMALSRVGRKLFDLIFKEYTLKQWDRPPSALDPLVTARIPVRTDFDSRYFSDRYQVLPSEGYTKFFEALLLEKELIQVETGVNFFDVQGDLEGRCSQTIFTGPVDQYFAEAGLDKLEYRSIRFQKEVLLDQGFFQPNSVVNYPSSEEEFTRIVEYKHFLHQDSPHTVIVKEFPSAIGDPYYPVPNPRNLALYNRYKELAAREERERKVFFVGRLANYKYFNMDAAIGNALDIFYKINDQPRMGELQRFY